MTDTYRVIRFYQDRPGYRYTVRRGLTLDEARAHCNDPETSSKTATNPRAKERTRLHGEWFDGYEQE